MPYLRAHKQMMTVFDIRPARLDFDALLACTSLTIEVRRAVVDALSPTRQPLQPARCGIALVTSLTLASRRRTRP